VRHDVHQIHSYDSSDDESVIRVTQYALTPTTEYKGRPTDVRQTLPDKEVVTLEVCTTSIIMFGVLVRCCSRFTSLVLLYCRGLHYIVEN
jgi:hypothetical protein